MTVGTAASRQAAHDADFESRVAEYLRSQPEFFERHLDLLGELRLPHPSGRAVSLVERQLDALRDEAAHYRQQIDTLVGVARDNDLLNDRLHHLTLALIDAADFAEVVELLEDHLHDEFKAEAVELKLFSTTRLREGGGEAEPELDAFLEFFERGRPVCGPLTPVQMDYLFGVQAEEMGSAAILPIQGDDILGVLAIGSTEPGRFHPDMGTDFLVRLTEIVSRKLQAVSLPGV
jgi:uncharacterized protein YigA (DUF484 family)